MKRAHVSLFAGAAIAVGLVAAWVTFAPAALGGQVTYITVTGSSMEPGLSDGDLVLARERASYQRGDVVVYRHADLGLVIHRIVDRDGASFVLQGDNNNFIDGEQPLQSSIAGGQWLTIPGAGRWLTFVREPAAVAALIFVAAFAVFWGEGTRPKRRRRTPTRRLGAETNAGART